MDTIHLKKLTKLQTPKATAVGVVQHPIQPSFQSMTSIFKFWSFTAEKMLGWKIRFNSWPRRNAMQSVLQGVEIIVSFFHSIGSTFLREHIDRKELYSLMLGEAIGWKTHSWNSKRRNFNNFSEFAFAFSFGPSFTLSLLNNHYWSCCNRWSRCCGRHHHHFPFGWITRSCDSCSNSCTSQGCTTNNGNFCHSLCNSMTMVMMVPPTMVVVMMVMPPTHDDVGKVPGNFCSGLWSSTAVDNHGRFCCVLRLNVLVIFTKIQGGVYNTDLKTVRPTVIHYTLYTIYTYSLHKCYTMLQL